jgi:hypothetical protein
MELFENIRKNLIEPMKKNFDDLVIVKDEKNVLEFYSGILEYERFVIHISNPVTDNRNITFIKIIIPLYDTISFAFNSVENNLFKLERYGSYQTNLFENLNNSMHFSYEEVISHTNNLINMLLKAYQSRNKLINDCLVTCYPNIERNIEFDLVKVPFSMRVNDNRNLFLFYYSHELNTFFLNDVFKTNYKSVINGIEEIASTLVKIYTEVDFNTVQWVNIFINLNNDGISFQKINLKLEKYIINNSLIDKLLFKKPKDVFVKYYSPDFTIDRFVSQNNIIPMWERYLIE